MHYARRMALVVGICGMLHMAAGAAMACPPASSGAVSGTNTVDTVNFSGSFSAGTYVLGVKASGTGTNKLTIKVEVPGTFGWSSIATRTIDLGNTNGCGYTEVQFVLGSSSDVRYRFSRKVGTSAIAYDWDHDFLVVWGGASFRCLTCN